MDTPMHIKIAEAAVDWLNGDCSKFWSPWREQLAITSNYPDYFAAGEIKAAEHELRDADWRDYTLIPNHSPSVAHSIYKPLDIRGTYPAVTDYWLEQIFRHIEAGNYAKAAKFAGTLSHIVGDTGQGAHVFDEQSLKRLLPHGNKRFIIHSTIEHVHGDIIRSSYKPCLLGSTLAELKWRLIEELELLKETNMAEVVPIMQAILADDTTAANASASRSLTSCAELFADLLYSIWQITQNNAACPTLSLKLTKLAPVSQRCDMLFNYEIMLDAIPGKEINHPLPLNLGGDNLRGIALLTEMSQAFSTTRDAYVEYAIPAGIFKNFTAVVGLNRGSINETEAIFKIKLNGNTVFTSPALGSSDPALEIRVDLGMATRVQLYVRDARPAPCITKFFYPVFANPQINQDIK